MCVLAGSGVGKLVFQEEGAACGRALRQSGPRPIRSPPKEDSLARACQVGRWGRGAEELGGVVQAQLMKHLSG